MCVVLTYTSDFTVYSWKSFLWLWYNLCRKTSLKGLMTLCTWQGMCWYQRNVCDWGQPPLHFLSFKKTVITVKYIVSWGQHSKPLAQAWLFYADTKQTCCARFEVATVRGWGFGSSAMSRRVSGLMASARVHQSCLITEDECSFFLRNAGNR
jgi:hypothetical protein